MGWLRKSRPLIVIVCTANITRSPYFAGRLQLELEQSGIPKHNMPEILSAGVAATNGVAAHPVMQTVAHLRGFSLGSHQAQRFDRELADRSSLVLTMEERHANQIKQEFPDIADRIFPMLGYGRETEYDGPLDVHDPTGGEVEEYETYANIADAQAQRLRRYFKKNSGVI